MNKAAEKTANLAPCGDDHLVAHLPRLINELLHDARAFAWISSNGHSLNFRHGSPEETFGMNAAGEMTFDSLLPVFAPRSRAAMRKALIASLNSGQGWFNLRMEIATGRRRGEILYSSGAPVNIGEARYLAGVFHGRRESAPAQHPSASNDMARENATRMLTQLLDVLPNAIAAYDADDRLIFFNRQYRLYYDKAAPAIEIGRKYEDILKHAVENGQYKNIDPALANSRQWMQERLDRHRKGMRRDLVQQLSSGRWVQVRERKSDDGHTIFVSTDITSLKEAEQQIREQADTDSLTGLLNRSSFLNELSAFLKYRRREGEDRGCLVLFDLDHFKSINDTFGHQTGDEYLRAMSGRLKKATRATDLVARLGGDEFAIFLPDIDESTVEQVINRLHAMLTTRMHLENRILNPGVSMGVVMVRSSDTSAGQLIRKADTALFQAKEAGRNQWRNFDRQLQKRRERRRYIASALRTALHDQAIRINLQPQVFLSTGEHAGFEVLSRWTHDGKPVSPAEFFPIAEEDGLIMELGQVVMEKSFSWFAQARKQGLNPGVLAINISPLELKCVNFLPALEYALKRHRLSPAEIEIELTETAIIGRDEELVEKSLHRIYEAGFRITLDDFGTGNATFSHLKRFPIQRLKIDKTFVDDIGKDPDNTIITKAIIDLGHNLGMDVVAEGIETRDQHSFLRIADCDIGQGYLFSRPLDGEAAMDWLKSPPPAPSASK